MMDRCKKCGRIISKTKVHICTNTSRNKGKHCSEESKAKMRAAKIGKKLSPEHREKVIKTLSGEYRFKKGFIPRNAGKEFEQIKGEKNHNRKGGISMIKGNISYSGQQRYKNIKKNGGFHTIGEWELLKKQYDYTCPSCNKKEPEIMLQKDHIIPLSKGGSSNIENIQPLCPLCNRKKYTQETYFIKKQTNGKYC